MDAQGKIRGHHFGEGKYPRSERTIRQLLTEAGAKNLPDPLDDTAGSGVSAASDSASVASPETYVGFERAANFASPGSFARDAVKQYQEAALLQEDNPEPVLLIADIREGRNDIGKSVRELALASQRIPTSQYIILEQKDQRMWRLNRAF